MSSYEKQFLSRLVITVIVGILIGIGIGFGIYKGDDILGFIGATIGVMGAFSLYKIQSYKEKNDENELNFNIMKSLLIYTISETDSMLDCMIKIYTKLYINNPDKIEKETVGYKLLRSQIEGKGNWIITINYKYDRGTFERMIESLGADDVAHKFFDSSMISKPLDKITFQLMRYDYSKTREDLIKEFRTIEDKKYMIYDKNWCNYIHNINSLEFKDIDVIIKWLNIINKPIDKIDERRKEVQLELEKLEERKVILDAINSAKNKQISEQNMLELHNVSRLIYLRKVELERLKKETIKHICEFVHYRDKIIVMLESKFKYSEFKTSANKVKEKYL